MSKHGDETQIDKYPEQQSPTVAPQLLSSELNPRIHNEENILTRNLHTLRRRSSDSPSPSPSPSNMLSSERQLSVRLSSFQENNDNFGLRRDSISPSSSISTVHDTVHETNFLNDRIQCLESEKLGLMVDHNNLIREFNKRMQSHLEEIRTLKDINQTVEQELNELRDLCCFLDDDRRKCRKLAKEWQKFGRHTVATLKSEVSAYQERQLCLENKHTHVLQENSELRDLCLHLDQQRTANENNIDEKDVTLKYIICPDCSSLRNVSDKTVDNGEMSPSNSENVVNLQNKVDQLEREKDMLHRLLMYGSKNRKEKKRVSFTFPDDGCDSSSTASELDMFDFPPSTTNLELYSRSNYMLDNADICNTGMTSLNIHTTGTNNRTDVNSIVCSSDNQIPPCSVPRLTSELSLQLNGGGDILVKNANTNILHKKKEDKGANNFTQTTNLPPYEESVRYLEITKGNQMNSEDKDMETKSNEV